MVNSKTTPYIVYFLVAAVVLFALAAIIASRSGGSSTEIQYTTCVQTEAERDFDVKATIIGPDWRQLPLVKYTSDIRVSEEDVHVIVAQEGSNEVWEHILKDGEYYSKVTGGVWEEPPAKFYNIHYVNNLINQRPVWMPGETIYPLCDKSGRNKAQIGHYTVKMALGHEYVTGPNNLAGYSPELIAEIPDTIATWEYRTGKDGKIQWSRHNYTVVGGEDWEFRETTATISGVGEPNVIVAPVMGSR